MVLRNTAGPQTILIIACILWSTRLVSAASISNLLKGVELALNTPLLAFWQMVQVEQLPRYLGLGLLLIIFVTYLRVRSRPA
jgi:hypothetical protein